MSVHGVWSYATVAYVGCFCVCMLGGPNEVMMKHYRNLARFQQQSQSLCSANYLSNWQHRSCDQVTRQDREQTGGYGANPRRAIRFQDCSIQSLAYGNGASLSTAHPALYIPYIHHILCILQTVYLQKVKITATIAHNLTRIEQG